MGARSAQTGAPGLCGVCDATTQLTMRGWAHGTRRAMLLPDSGASGNEWGRFFDAHAPDYMTNIFTGNTLAEVDFAVQELGLTP